MVILIVDDDERVGRVLAELVESLGHTVISADSLRAARKALEEQRIDCALVDTNLGKGEDGFALVPFLQVGPTPFFGMSGGGSYVEETWLNIGALGFLEKPMTRQDIQEAFEILARMP